MFFLFGCTWIKKLINGKYEGILPADSPEGFMKLKDTAIKFITTISMRSPFMRKAVNYTGLSLGSTAFIMSGNICTSCVTSVSATTIGAAFFISLTIGGLIYLFTKIKTAARMCIFKGRSNP